MGNTFSLTLFQKNGPLAAMKKELILAFEAMGYVKTSSGDPDACAFPIFAPRKGAWNALSLPDTLSDDEDFIRQLSARLNTPFLSFFNFDSDLMILQLTDGEQTQSISCGAAADSLPEPPVTDEALAFFDALLSNDASRASFREIIAQKPDFSEEIADSLAPLLNYPEALVYTDELHDPSAVLYFRKLSDIPDFLLSETDPPSFRTYAMHTSFSNPTHLCVRPCGGKGRGVRLMLVAIDYDPEDWHVPVVALRRGQFDFHEHAPDEYIRATPVRCTFASGSVGWYADFPDIEIAPGAIYEPLTARKAKYMDQTAITVHIPFCGGKFHHDYRTSGSTQSPEAFGGKTRIILAPLENPEGFASATVARYPFEPNPSHYAWLGNITDEYQ